MNIHKKAPTIQDVARFAGVSTATISRSLSSPERVSTKTRARVDEAVRATGYKINYAASSLRKRSTKTIVVALPNVGNTFFTPIVDAIERAASKRNYSVLLSNRHVGQNVGSDLRDFFLSNRADGLLLFDGSIDIASLQMSSGPQPEFFPTVVVCEDIVHSLLPTVKTDNQEGARLAVRYLIDLGHTRIAHLASPKTNALYYERSAGYRAALSEAGVECHDEWELSGDFSMKSGVDAAHAFMQIKHRPTAIFCGSDDMAVGLISELRSLGVDCPRDVSIVGFDDIPVAQYFWPRLTTIRQQNRELGQLATEKLIAMLEGKTDTAAPSRVVLPCELIVRGSTAPIRT